MGENRSKTCVVEVKRKCDRRASSVNGRTHSNRVVRVGRLEGAPIPAPRDTGGNLLTRGCRRGLATICYRGIKRIGRGAPARAVCLIILSVDLVLDLVESVGASLFPALVGTPAEVAGSRRNALWVEARSLVEGNHVGSVR
jgi:hypothetical protein